MPIPGTEGFRVIIPLPEPWFTEIGRVAVYWSQLEDLADRCLQDFLDHPQAAEAKAAFGYKGHLGIAFKRRMNLWRRVAAEVLPNHASHLSELLNLIDQLSEYRGKRDEYIHGVWGVGHNDVAVQRRSLGRALNPHPEIPVTVEQLKDFSRKLSNLNLNLFDIVNHSGLWRS
jgi:hypothetical protein